MFPGQSVAERLVSVLGQRDGFACIPASHIHLTLRYLGPVLVDQAALARATDRALKSLSPLTLTTTEFLVFPTLAAPRAIALGVAADEPEPLSEFTNRLDRVCRDLDLSDRLERFRPHLTVARVRGPVLLPPPPPPVSFHIDRVDLVGSRSRPEGTLYRRLHSFPLHG